ncbi:4'-phosphopantetheinyl transferase family protein [Hyphomonas sp.]|jgi:phosphopantetheinyl transferase|uniref:4'-phosphopantetheinyl transferase family protein n=1 Tax=Hyphomonas sp. TaxID=87 RepID=UPI0037C023D0
MKGVATPLLLTQNIAMSQSSDLFFVGTSRLFGFHRPLLMGFQLGPKLSEQAFLQAALQWAHPDEIQYIQHKYRYSPLTVAASLLLRRMVRQQLASSIGVGINNIAILSTRGGKPAVFICNELSPTLNLSISHSGPFAVVLLSERRCCGIDIQSLGGYNWNGILDYVGWASLLQNSEHLVSVGGRAVSRVDGVSADQLIACLWCCYESWYKLGSGNWQFADYRPIDIKLFSAELDESICGSVILERSMPEQPSECIFKLDASNGYVLGLAMH